MSHRRHHRRRFTTAASSSQRLEGCCPGGGEASTAGSLGPIAKALLHLGESLMCVYWVAVPKTMRARRSNRRSPRSRPTRSCSPRPSSSARRRPGRGSASSGGSGCCSGSRRRWCVGIYEYRWCLRACVCACVCVCVRPRAARSMGRPPPRHAPPLRPWPPKRRGTGDDAITMAMLMLNMALLSCAPACLHGGADGAVTGCHAGGGHRCGAVRPLRQAALEAGPSGAGRRGDRANRPPPRSAS